MTHAFAFKLLNFRKALAFRLSLQDCLTKEIIFLRSYGVELNYIVTRRWLNNMYPSSEYKYTILSSLIQDKHILNNNVVAISMYIVQYNVPWE